MEQKEHNLVLILSRYTQNTKIVITRGILNSLQNLLAFHIIKIGLNTAVRVWVMSVGHITLWPLCLPEDMIDIKYLILTRVREVVNLFAGGLLLKCLTEMAQFPPLNSHLPLYLAAISQFTVSNTMRGFKAVSLLYLSKVGRGVYSAFLCFCLI